MIPLLIEAAQEMDTIFWQQVYPARDSLLAAVARLSDPRATSSSTTAPGTGSTATRLRARRRYRAPTGPRSIPHDMTKEEFEAAAKAAPDGGRGAP